jgi:hypothetical protein
MLILFVGHLYAEPIIVEGTSFIGRAHEELARSEAEYDARCKALAELGVVLTPLHAFDDSAEKSAWAAERLRKQTRSRIEIIDLGFT